MGGLFSCFGCGSDVEPTTKPGPNEVPAEHRDSCVVLSQLVSKPTKRNSLVALEGESARHMTNLLSQVLGDGSERAMDSSRREVLRVLSRLAKSTETLPTRLQLVNDVQCKFSDPDRSDTSGFCRVYEGTLSGGQPDKVWVKVAAIFPANTQKRKSTLLKILIKHAIFSAHVSHPNILPIYGFTHHSSYKICVVSPWMDHNLKEHLIANQPKASPQDHLLFMLDIITGLEYLHNLQIIHRDIRAENIFVSREGRALLTNFGASRTVDSTNTHDSAGSAFWMAPELYNQGKVSTKSDIWAFACTCYEIVQGSPPFRVNYPTHYKLESFFLEGGNVTPPKPDIVIKTWSKEQQKIWDQLLMAKCWQRHPNERPEAKTVSQSFQRLNIPDQRSEPSGFPRPPRIDPQIDYGLVRQTLLEIQKSA